MAFDDDPCGGGFHRLGADHHPAVERIRSVAHRDQPAGAQLCVAEFAAAASQMTRTLMLRRRRIKWRPTTMTGSKNADRRAEEKGSGKEGPGNEAGTATGPGSSSASASKSQNQRDIGGSGSAKAQASRPGHKTIS
jgi:hypothetical protein